MIGFEGNKTSVKLAAKILELGLDVRQVDNKKNGLGIFQPSYNLSNLYKMQLVHTMGYFDKSHVCIPRLKNAICKIRRKKQPKENFKEALKGEQHKVLPNH